MGGGYYDRDVYEASSSAAAGYSDMANQVLQANKELHKALDPKRFAEIKLESNTKHPIVFVLDVTGSMGDWTKIIYDKLPMFYGQIMVQKYLEEPSISFCAVGDHRYDKAPLQITEFGEGKEIDQLISKVWLEEGGGGNGVQSYHLAAYFYNQRTDLKGQQIPFFFITGDQKYYPFAQKQPYMKVIGVKGQQCDSEILWKSLMKKYNVFYLNKPYQGSGIDIEVLKQWTNTMGPERVLKLKSAKACIDVMLGAIAITSGARTLETYLQDMKERGQDESRLKQVTEALKKYAEIAHEISIKIGISQSSHQEEKKIEHEEQTEIVRKEVMNELVKLESWKDLHSALQERQDLKKRGIHIPNDFLCPITKEIFINPVMIDDGNTYERCAIQIWLKHHNTSPITKSSLTSKGMMPNLTIQRIIEKFIKDHK